MVKKLSSALMAALLLGATSCSDDNPWMGETGQGGIKLILSTDGNIEDVIPNTRADGADYFEKPTASQFNIHLIKPEGQIHTDLPHDEFVRKSSFPSGTYTLKAFTGSLDDEGYDVRPYFEGTTKVTVLEGVETEVSVNATLGHTLVSVAYTDAFKSYMKSYSANLHSAGHSYVDVPDGETGPAFLVPGQVSLTLDFTDPQGRQLTLHPAEFKADAAKHYQIELNVNNGNVENAALEISFVSNTDKETVSIDLSDELFSAPEPEVKPVGFEDNQVMQFLSGERANENCSFTVLSYGGLRDVTLTFNKLDGDYTSPFGSEVNLIGATESLQAQLASAGIDCTGVFKNPSKMAKIDLARLPEMLPAGKYQVSVRATDMLARSSQPVSVIISLSNSTVKIEPVEANLSTLEGSLIVTYNGSNPTADLTFKADNEYGMKVEAPIIRCTPATRSIEENQYNIVIRLPKQGEYSFNRGAIEVEANLKGQYASKVDLPIATSFETDAFATKVLLKPICLEEKVAEILLDAQVAVFKNGSQVNTTVSKNSSAGVIVVEGLEPNTDYTFIVSGYEDGKSFEYSFITESPVDLNNGTFDSANPMITYTVASGGKYTSLNVTGVTYQYLADIKFETPAGWGDINSVTCNPDLTSNQNTWYMVPSTYLEGGKAKVRSVGYSYNGPELPRSDSPFFPPYKYYNQNAPDNSQLTKAAGKLYYGDDEVKGAPFNTRPSSMSFDYEYDAKNNESANAKITVFSGNEVIASGSKDISGNSGSIEIPLSYSPSNFGKLATSIAIVFVSSNAETPYIYIPSGTELNEGYNTAPSNRNIGTGYKAKATGSELTVDNVKLNY